MIKSSKPFYILEEWLQFHVQHTRQRVFIVTYVDNASRCTIRPKLPPIQVCHCICVIGIQAYRKMAKTTEACETYSVVSKRFCHNLFSSEFISQVPCIFFDHFSWCDDFIVTTWEIFITKMMEYVSWTLFRSRSEVL